MSLEERLYQGSKRLELAWHGLQILHLPVHGAGHLLQPAGVPCNLHHLVSSGFRQELLQTKPHLSENLRIVQHLSDLWVSLHHLLHLRV